MGKSCIESSADCGLPHRASPLVSPKPAEARRLPPPLENGLSPSGSGSLHCSALRNRVRPLPARRCFRFVPFHDTESGGHRQQAETMRQTSVTISLAACANKKILNYFSP